ncbi:hypothetical protein QEZ54_19665 [Catellatospora sp. KI3]|uniref:hypothetical protein n=1 Tax=Catellatospora sp. KI3 TaxID=3041620 RepID=UPI00248248AB|nr:hypothetical protein [Catellatospora sp. KI3]MDI1463202.1 hypothetical protein [Catellatospora sp. KI3]
MSENGAPRQTGVIETSFRAIMHAGFDKVLDVFIDWLAGQRGERFTPRTAFKGLLRTAAVFALALFLRYLLQRYIEPPVRARVERALNPGKRPDMDLPSVLAMVLLAVFLCALVASDLALIAEGEAKFHYLSFIIKIVVAAWSIYAIYQARSAVRPTVIIYVLTITPTTLAPILIEHQGKWNDLPYSEVVAISALVASATVVMMFFWRSRGLQLRLNKRQLKSTAESWFLAARQSTMGYGTAVAIPFSTSLNALYGDSGSRGWIFLIMMLWAAFTAVIRMLTWAATMAADKRGIQVDQRTPSSPPKPEFARRLVRAVIITAIVGQLTFGLAVFRLQGLLTDGIPILVACGLGVWTLMRFKFYARKPDHAGSNQVERSHPTGDEVLAGDHRQ